VIVYFFNRERFAVLKREKFALKLSLVII